MANVKISDLPLINGSPLIPGNSVFPVVRNEVTYKMTWDQIQNNITASGANPLNITGTGTTGTITKWTTGGSVIGDSVIVESGNNVGIGVSPVGISTFTTLHIDGATGGGIKIGKTGQNPMNIQHDGSDGYINNTASGNLFFYTADNPRLTISSGGAIGQAVTPVSDPYISGAEQWMTYQIGKGGVMGAYKANNESMFGFNTYLKATDGANKAIISGIDGSAMRYYADRMTFNFLPSTGTAQTQTEAMRITSVGAIGIDNSSPDSFNGSGSTSSSLVIGKGTSSISPQLTLWQGNSAQASINFASSNSGTGQYEGRIRYTRDTGVMDFRVNSNDALTISSGGAVKIGTGGTADANGLCIRKTGNHLLLQNTGTTAYWNFDVTSNNLLSIINSGGTNALSIASGGEVGISATPTTSKLNVKYNAGGTDAGESVIAANVGDNATITSAIITARNAGNRGSKGNSQGTALFKAEFNDATAMIIDKDGKVLVGMADASTQPTNSNFFIADAQSGPSITVGGHGGAHTAILFRHNGATTQGSIVITTNSTAYNISSDYRLKENVTPITDALSRVNQLKPSRFNFISESDRTVDGFLAHEVKNIIPEAISGEKDAVNEDGTPDYQGIDQSKIVPLLTAAIQEQQTLINTLTARIDTLENN